MVEKAGTGPVITGIKDSPKPHPDRIAAEKEVQEASMSGLTPEVEEYMRWYQVDYLAEDLPW